MTELGARSVWDTGAAYEPYVGRWSRDVPTHFRDFDDYWLPFLGGQFPAPDYAVSLSEDDPARSASASERPSRFHRTAQSA